MFAVIPILVFAAVLHFTSSKDDDYFCLETEGISYCEEREVSTKDFK